METLTCAIYIQVNKLQYDMFLKKYQSHTNTLNISNDMDMSFLSPCCSVLKITYRVNYQVFVWIHSHENRQYLPDLDKSGWQINGEEIEYDWVKGNLIVPEQLIDILCEQNVMGDADQDRDKDDGVGHEGVEMTNMVDEVFKMSLVRIKKVYGENSLNP